MLEYESLEDIEISLADGLVPDEDERTKLLEALDRSRWPLDGTVIPVYQEDYQLVCYWYAVAKAQKRAANGNKQEWQLYEDYLEAAVKGMNSRLMAAAHLNKMDQWNR